MIALPQYAGKTVAVMGLGRSGLASARALIEGGAEVWAWDDVPAAREAARARGVPLEDLGACDWSRPAALVLSPGIPLRHPAPHPVVATALEAGCEVVGETELLFRARPEARFVGVTGTNGKSTTTALVGHVLETGGMRAETGGNLGTPALALAPLGADGTYVLEMSSYQLDLTVSVRFDVAVLLNLTPDHLERHGGMDGYVAAKFRVFAHQGKDDTAVVGVDDRASRDVFERLRRAAAQRLVPISCERRIEGGVFVIDGLLYDDTAGRAAQVADLNRARALPGVHNWQNAAAAYAAARAVGMAPERIAAALVSYPGLPHRQELVAVIDGVRYVNDSKATNAEATARALACYRNIFWIAGGRAKAGGIEPLGQWFPRIAHAFLVGEAEEEFARTLEGRVPATRCGDLATAVRRAAEAARAAEAPDPVVLLSPAAASFDQWRDFEARGEGFRELVAALPGRRAAPGDADGGPPLRGAKA